MAKIAILSVTPEFLGTMLHLPDGTHVEDMRFSPERNCFELRVGHEDFGDVASGNLIPHVSLNITQHTHCCPDDNSIWHKLIGHWSK